MTNEIVVHRTMALALASLEYWHDLDHRTRRFAYETVNDMQRLGLSVEQYEHFLTWLSHQTVTRPR